MANEGEGATAAGVGVPAARGGKHVAEGGALYRDEIHAPVWFQAALLLPALIALLPLPLAPAPIPAAVVVAEVLTALAMLLSWALLSVLRVTVSEEEVLVQYGLFGPRIPLSAIEGCALVEHDWKKHGGWGIQRGRDGSVAYNLVGDGGRAVVLSHREGGTVKKLLLASPDPEGLAAAIELAREARGAAKAPAGRAKAPAA